MNCGITASEPDRPIAPSSGVELAAGDAQQGGLAGAVRSDQRGDLRRRPTRKVASASSGRPSARL